MNFDYVIKLDLPLNQAWETLMDIEHIAPCMPGATIESHDGDDYTGRLDVRLGPMDMTYHGNIHFVERDDAAKTALVDASANEIKGRGAAKTQISLRGTAIDQRSEITLSSEFSVSGKATQFGRNVMEEVGEALMDNFATRLAAKVHDDANTVARDVVLTNSLNRSSGQHTPANQAIETPNSDGRSSWPIIKRFAIGTVITAVVVAFYLSL